MDFIKVDNISFIYDETEEAHRKQGHFVLKDISFSVRKGEFVALIGHNGSGKSTVAKHLNAMLTPTKGKVYIDGMDTSDENLTYDIRRKVGLVLQNPDNQLVASIVEEDVAFGPENIGIPPEEIRKRVDEALKAVDMYDYRLHAPHKLSGGQKQRIAIAGIIAMKPDCIVLDEPTAMLDPKGRKEVMDTILKLNREAGITIVMITHNMEEAVLADNVFVIDNGGVLISGTPSQVFTQVELLKRHRLDVPQVTELCYMLRSWGVELDTLPLFPDECVKMLKEVLR
ncbi:MAG: energy-coupling factor transporter ATPase [Ruminococcus sp.]|nr:energy-coupling factor transporter ATPase [Ruminococcus sp.]